MPSPKAPRGKSLVRKRTIEIGGLKSSVTLEDSFWHAFKDIAAAHGTTIRRLIMTINIERRERQHTNLLSAIRLFVLDYYRQQIGRGPLP